MLNLVGRSLDTSRRFDALKILVGLRSTGRARLAAMVEGLVDLAQAAAALVEAHDELELLAPPSTVMVVFRWRPAGRRSASDALDAANVAAQRALLRGGRALVGRTRLDGRVALKLTLVNPLARARTTCASCSSSSRARRGRRRSDDADRDRAGARGAATAAASRVARRRRARALRLRRRAGPRGGRRDRDRDAAELLPPRGRRLALCAPAHERPEHARAGDTHVALLSLPGRPATLVAGVRYLSATQRHRFRTPVTMSARRPRAAPGPRSSAWPRMLVDELAATRGARSGGERRARPHPGQRRRGRRRSSRRATPRSSALWSARAARRSMRLRAGAAARPHAAPDAEEPLGDEPATRAYSPELRPHFQLHWLAVDAGARRARQRDGHAGAAARRALLRDDPAVDARRSTRRCAGSASASSCPPTRGRLAHLRAPTRRSRALLRRRRDRRPRPARARRSRRRRRCARSTAPTGRYQLKFSLHARVTNSMRVTLPKELRARGRGGAAAADAGRRARGADRAPTSRCCRTRPTSRCARGRLIDGFSVLLRENRWPAGAAPTSAR